MAKNFTHEDVSKALERARAELESFEAIELETEIVEEIDRFKRKFQKCEITYKALLKVYDAELYEHEPSKMKITMKQVSPVLNKFAKFNLKDSFMQGLFGSEKRVGMRSAKVLRDTLTHSLPRSAVEELQVRSEELHNMMDTYLALFRTADENNPKNVA